MKHEYKPGCTCYRCAREAEQLAFEIAMMAPSPTVASLRAADWYLLIQKFCNERAK